MTRASKYADGPSWADVAEMVEAWEVELGIQMDARIAFRKGLATGAWVEVVVHEGRVIGTGLELYRIRAAFPARKGSGHAGAVLNAISQAVRELDNTPWNWSTKMRRDRLPKG